MWIAMNNAFLSIVQPKAKDVPQPERKLKSPMMVRARKAGHLKAIFPEHRIYQWKGRDYPARVFVEREELANRIGAAILAIGYDNFKNSVKDDPLHSAYAAVWGVMFGYENGRYDAKPKTQMPGFWDGFNGDTFDLDDDEYDELDMDAGGRFSTCSRDDCSDDHPCPVCIQMTIDGETPGGDRYGDYDTGEDEADYHQHLQVPPGA